MNGQCDGGNPFLSPEVDTVVETFLSNIWQLRRERLTIGNRSDINKALSSGGRVAHGLTTTACKTLATPPRPLRPPGLFWSPTYTTHTCGCGDILQLELEWMYSADDSLGPPGDAKRRFTLPMDLVFDKVCALLHKLSGRAQLPPASKVSPPSSASAALSGKTNRGGGWLEDRTVDYGLHAWECV